MPILYGRPFCPLFRQIAMGLREKRLDFEEKNLSQSFLEENKSFLTLTHPQEIVVFGEKKYAFDNPQSICLYLEHAYPSSPSLLGETSREVYQIAKWLYWCYQDLNKSIVFPIFTEVLDRRKRGGTPRTEAIVTALKKSTLWLKSLNQCCRDHPFLGGDYFSWADMAVSASLSFLEYFGHISWKNYQDLKLWFVKIKSRPSFRPFLAETLPGIPPSPTYSLLDY